MDEAAAPITPAEKTDRPSILNEKNPPSEEDDSSFSTPKQSGILAEGDFKYLAKDTPETVKDIEEFFARCGIEGWEVVWPPT